MHDGAVGSLAWNGNLLASGTESWTDKTIKIWDTDKIWGTPKIRDADKCKCIKTLEGHTDTVTSVAWIGQLLARRLGTIRSRSGTLKCASTLNHISSTVESLAWNGNLLASGDNDGRIRIWTIRVEQ